jgi:hypothetical protein
MICRLSEIVDTLEGIDSVELNPVLVMAAGSGAIAVDALASADD